MEELKTASKFYTIFIFICLYVMHSSAANYGYTNDIKAERENIYEEIVIFPPQVSGSKNLNEKIFNAELSKEFRTKYIQEFGTVDTDSFVYRDPKYAEMADDNRRGVSTEVANNNARRNFGDFMVKRLTEWHVDHYIKEEPQMRPIYEAKEKISNIKVEINKETRLDIKYSLAGNTLDLNIINPYLESRLISYMDPSAFGPAQTLENRLFLGMQINPLLRFNLYVAENDGIATAEVIRAFRGNISTSLSSSSWFKATGLSARETRTSVGMSTTF